MSRVQAPPSTSMTSTTPSSSTRPPFGAAPAKRRPGYANFALDEPALKLVLIENPGSGGSLNHLGVEVGVRRRGDRPRPAALAGTGL